MSTNKTHEKAAMDLYFFQTCRLWGIHANKHLHPQSRAPTSAEGVPRREAFCTWEVLLHSFPILLTLYKYMC